MKKAYFIIMLAVAALTLASCGSLDSVVDQHNRLMEKHNRFVNDINNALY